MKKRLISITSVCISCLIVVVLALLIAIGINPDNVYADSGYNLVIKKTPTITVYVTGENVEKVSSSLAEDRYLVTKDSQVTLYAVNETKIFEKWAINDSNSQTEELNNPCSFTVSNETTVEALRRDPVSVDRGRYMYNKFVVAETSHLIAISKILEHGPNVSSTDTTLIDYYDMFFETYPEYEDLKTYDEKATYITSHNFHKLIQYGYYLVEGNIALMDPTFTGIGTSDYPFRGVMCGNNDGTYSKIITTITATESSGNNYYGLFKVLDNEAVIRNLLIYTSIGITKNASAVNSNIYLGGVSGYFNNAMIYNCEVKTVLSTDAYSSNVYAGGIAGYLCGGFSGLNQITYNGSDTSWALNVNGTNNDEVYSGYIAGMVNLEKGIEFSNGETLNLDNKSKSQIYFKSVDVKLTDATLNSTNTKGELASANLIGYLYCDDTIELDDMTINSTSSYIQGVINEGNAYVGGLIGFVEANKTGGSLEVGKVTFNSIDGEDNYIALTKDANSKASVYTGGLFAYINSDPSNQNVYANDDFKDGFYTEEIDGKEVLRKRYIFNGNTTIRSVQNGKVDINRTYGKCISGGLVGKGLFHINGTSSDESNILLCNGGKFNVEAIQSSTSSALNNDFKTDIEHCIASMTFGILASDNSYSSYKFNDINIYATNAYVTATREVGSRALGDMRVSGFIGYLEEIDVENLELYVNQSKFDLQSLSYEMQIGAKNNENSNAFCGGVFGQIKGDLSKNRELNITKVNVLGYATSDLSPRGTTLKLSSLQNTQAGGHDTMGENYVGGIVGFMSYVNVMEKCNYYGHKSSEDEIIMQGHQSPDSSFAGGIVGLIWDDSINAAKTYYLRDCEVRNATIKAYATTTKYYNNPDMYCGGIIGASFHKDGKNTTNEFSQLRVFDSEITANGNERIEVYCAGINGGITWADTQNFTECYVYNTKVSAYANSLSSTSGDGKDEAYAAGIVAHNTSTKSTISNCAVINSKIYAESTYNKTYVGGLCINYNNGNYTIRNNYINSTLQKNAYNVSYNFIFAYNKAGTTTLNANNYYTSNLKNNNLNQSGSATDGSGNSYQIEVPLDNYEVAGKGNFDLLDSDSIGTKFYPVLSQGDNSQFSIGNAGTNNTVTIAPNTSSNNASDLVDLWVNVKSGGSEYAPTSYARIEDAYIDGWFCLGTIIVYSGSNSEFVTTITDVDTTYIDDNSERYKYSSEDENGNRYLYHETYQSYRIQSGYKEIISDDITNKTFYNWNIIKEYNIKVHDNIPSMEIKFRVNTQSVYNLQIRDDSRNILDPLSNDFGVFSISSEVISSQIEYTVKFTPDEESSLLAESTVYITFSIGSGGTEKSALRIVFTPNVKVLSEIDVANYSPALNNAEEGLGTMENPYVLRIGSTTKFIPVFLKSNDFTNTRFDSDTNIEYVNYSLSDSSMGEMKSSGELVISNSISFSGERTDAFYIEVSVIEGVATGEAIKVYLVVARDTKNVVFSLKGATSDGYSYASTTTDYYFTIEKYANYSGIPQMFNVTIGSTVYDLLTNPGGIVLSNGKNIVFKDSLKSYDIKIPSSLIDGDISIEVEMIVVYEVKLILNCESFNPNFVGVKEKTFHIKSGDTLNNYFYGEGKTQIINGEVQSLQLVDVETWVNEAQIYGYTFNGFFLVDDANSQNSYGRSFEAICNDTSQNMQVSTNITFYGSWSFLIELIEAPGTKIKSSFPDSFMKDYETDLVNNVIRIPINSNRGYVFTIEKEEGFYGEAGVNAYSVTREHGQNIVEEIKVEKYHDNMYLYYISPENIKGYLVIQTSATNSEIIVGENTSNVSEEIIPADGIYTFKYAINHTNISGEKSFIYNYLSNVNNSLNKEFTLDFYKQTYYSTDKCLQFYSSDGLMQLDFRYGEVGYTNQAGRINYHLIFGDTSVSKTTLTSQKIENGIKNITLAFPTGSVDSTVVKNMKVWVNTDYQQTGWVELTDKSYDHIGHNDIITYNNLEAKYKYFYVSNYTNTKQYIYYVDVVDNQNKTLSINFNKELQEDDVDGKLDRTYVVNDGFKLSPRELKVGTIVEVYYYKYVNGILETNIIGNYEVDHEGVTSIKLSEFTLLDGTTQAFKDEKFSTFLSNTEGVISEVYYFSITPVNGYQYDEADKFNYVINSGYIDSNGEFISANKTSKVDIDNKPLEDDFGEILLKETALQKKVYTITNSRYTNLEYNENKYIFSDVTKYDVYKLNVSSPVIPESGVMPNYISLVNKIGYDTYLSSSELSFYIGKLSFTAFSEKNGIINIYGCDDLGKWSKAFSITVEEYVTKEYVIDLTSHDFVKYRLDSESDYEIIISKLSITDKVTNVDYSIDFTKDNEYVISGKDVIYNVSKDIVGDTRHEGKKFMLALQLVSEDGTVLKSLPNGIYLKTSKGDILPNDHNALGLNVMYFNLSSLITDTTSQYDFTIENLPSGYTVVVQLLEVVNAQKPAMGEVRYQLIDGVIVKF